MATTTYVQDDTVDPSFNNIQGLNLDDERTQAVLHRTRSFAKKYPRKHKNEMFTAYECSSISTYLNGTQPGIDTTKDEVEHILSVSYRIFRDYCALMCYGLHGATKNLAFNCKTGEVCPLMTKHKMTARTFYACHRSTIQSFDLLRSIFLYTWDHYFGVEGIHPYVEVGGDPLAIANDPPVNTSTFGDEGVSDVLRVIANEPPLNSVLQQTNKRTRDDIEKDSSRDSEAVPSTPLDTGHNVD